ncbi:MAG: zinc-ribbon domain-containing protein [Candidatus Bathyarchaeia archaeon]
MVYCSKCGSRVPDDARFCPVCGAPMPAQAVPPPPPTTPARPPIVRPVPLRRVILADWGKRFLA